MKLGMMIYSLGGALADERLTVPGALALMKECGCEGVDISSWHVGGYTNAEVKQMVADAGLVTSCYIGGASLTMGPGAERSAAMDEMRKIIDATAETEAVCALLTTGGRAEGQCQDEARRNVSAGLAELLPYAKSLGVTLTIEDFGSPMAPYQIGAECLECVEIAGPEMMITYDSGNMVMGDEDPVAFLDIVKSRVVHAHAKDWELLPPDADFGLTSRAGKKYIGTTCGQGVLDYPAIIAALQAMNYDGYLSFEYEGRGDCIQAAREGTAYLLGLMG